MQLPPALALKFCYFRIAEGRVNNLQPCLRGNVRNSADEFRTAVQLAGFLNSPSIQNLIDISPMLTNSQFRPLSYYGQSILPLRSRKSPWDSLRKFPPMTPKIKFDVIWIACQLRIIIDIVYVMAVVDRDASGIKKLLEFKISPFASAKRDIHVAVPLFFLFFRS
jgi:hypothetical protein